MRSRSLVVSALLLMCVGALLLSGASAQGENLNVYFLETDVSTDPSAFLSPSFLRAFNWTLGSTPATPLRIDNGSPQPLASIGLQIVDAEQLSVFFGSVPLGSTSPRAYATELNACQSTSLDAYTLSTSSFTGCPSPSTVQGDMAGPFVQCTSQSTCTAIFTLDDNLYTQRVSFNSAGVSLSSQTCLTSGIPIMRTISGDPNVVQGVATQHFFLRDSNFDFYVYNINGLEVTRFSLENISVTRPTQAPVTDARGRTYPVFFYDEPTDLLVLSNGEDVWTVGWDPISLAVVPGSASLLFTPSFSPLLNQRTLISAIHVDRTNTQTFIVLALASIQSGTTNIGRTEMQVYEVTSSLTSITSFSPFVKSNSSSNLPLIVGISTRACVPRATSLYPDCAGVSDSLIGNCSASGGSTFCGCYPDTLVARVTTSSSSSSSSSSTSSTTTASDGASIGLIVGLSVGIPIGILLLIGLVYFIIYGYAACKKEMKKVGDMGEDCCEGMYNGCARFLSCGCCAALCLGCFGAVASTFGWFQKKKHAYEEGQKPLEVQVQAPSSGYDVNPDPPPSMGAAMGSPSTWGAPGETPGSYRG